MLYDWRLRECDYGQRNGMPVAELHAGRRQHLDEPYPGGESWRQAAARVGRFLADLPLRWDGQRVLVIGHVATRWGLDHLINGVPLEGLAAQDFACSAAGSTGSADNEASPTAAPANPPGFEPQRWSIVVALTTTMEHRRGWR